jgi:hypothetical protein
MRAWILLPLLCALGLGSTARAATVTPGGTLLPGTSAASEPNLAGSVVATWLQPFSYDVKVTPITSAPFIDTVTGSVTSQVVRSIDGTLDFYWQIAVNHGQLTSFTLGSFVASAYRANWRTDMPGDEAPTFARIAGPRAVEFGFFPLPAGAPPGLDPLSTGEKSAYFLLDTDARAFGRGASYALDSNAFTDAKGRSVAYATFGPTAVPEPQTWALMAAGIVGLGIWARRSRREG